MSYIQDVDNVKNRVKSTYDLKCKDFLKGHVSLKCGLRCYASPDTGVCIVGVNDKCFEPPYLKSDEK